MDVCFLALLLLLLLLLLKLLVTMTRADGGLRTPCEQAVQSLMTALLETGRSSLITEQLGLLIDSLLKCRERYERAVPCVAAVSRIVIS